MSRRVYAVVNITTGYLIRIIHLYRGASLGIRHHRADFFLTNTGSIRAVTEYIVITNPYAIHWLSGELSRLMRIVPLCFVALIGLNLGVAQAFCRETTESNKYRGCPKSGIPLYLDCGNMNYSVCPREVDEPPFDEVVEIIEDSFLTWALIECGGETLDFQFIPEEEPQGCDQSELYNRDTKVDPTPDENLIIFVQDGDVFDESEDDLDAYALTLTWFDRNTGAISGFDMLINDSQSLGRLGICDPTKKDCDDIVDLQNLFTHEIGHVLGLGHTDDPTAVMFRTSLNGDIKKRVLKADDIDGICEIYSENPPSYCSEAESRRTTCACAIVGGRVGDRRFGVEILLPFLAVLALIFRRSVHRPDN